MVSAKGIDGYCSYYHRAFTHHSRVILLANRQHLRVVSSFAFGLFTSVISGALAASGVFTRYFSNPIYQK